MPLHVAQPDGTSLPQIGPDGQPVMVQIGPNGQPIMGPNGPIVGPPGMSAPAPPIKKERKRCIQRAAAAPIERRLAEGGVRKLSRDETPALLWGFVSSLKESLVELEQETRVSSCPGLEGARLSTQVFSNLQIFHANLARAARSTFWLRTWDLSTMNPFLYPDMRLYSKSGWLSFTRAEQDYKGERPFHIVANNDFERMQDLVWERDPKRKRHPRWIASEYRLPYLWEKRKWDFRVHVVVLGFDPLRLFLGSPDTSYARVAMQPFTMDNLDARVHDVKHGTKLGPQGGGNGDEKRIRALRDLQPLLGDKDWALMWKQVERIAVETILAVEPRMRDSGRALLQYSDQCFETLGIDLALDKNKKVYLLEVHRNPAPTYYNVAQAAARNKVLHDSMCLAGLTCAQASVDPVQPLPAQERPFLQPFEWASDELERLTEEHRRLLARAARTEFSLIWPPPPHLQNLLMDMNLTEEWAPSYYSKHLLQQILQNTSMHQAKRRLGVKNSKFVMSG